MDENQNNSSAGVNKPAVTLTMPVAIVAAAAIIGLALIITRAPASPNKAPTENVQTGEQFVRSIVSELKIKKEAFDACLADKTALDKVSRDTKNAIDAGGQGTPFTVLITDSGKRVAIGGAQPYERVKALIDEALAGTLVDSQDANLAKVLPVDDQDHVFGPASAPITLIEYSDFQCPFCARFHPTLERLVNEYPNQIRWVYRHYPLESIHPQALPAAVSSVCVARLKGNDAFWQFASTLFANQTNLK